MSNADSALNYLDEGDAQLDLFSAQPALWIPPTVDLVCDAPRVPSCPEAGTGPWLLYPDDDYRQWPRKTETKGLLRAFLRLAELTLAESKDREEVREFAQTWGPLWLCQTSGHRGYGSADCFYRAWPERASHDCLWHPREPGAVFVRKAQEAQAVMDIVEALSRGRSVPVTLWQRTGLDRRRQGLAERVAQWSRDEQCAMIAQVVSCHLLSYAMPVLLMTWEEAREPRLILGTGSGFLRAVWLEIAQRLCKAKGFCTCTACGKVFVPPERYTPRENQSKACSEACKKIIKNLAKARERARKRVAQAGEDAAETVGEWS
jgi:hypothetical protein